MACDELVSPDDESCPHGHLLPTRQLSAPPEGISGVATRRPRLATNEQFEEVEVEADDVIAARVVADPNRLGVAYAAVTACAEHHGIDEERSRAELRLLAARAIEAGAWWRSATGFWQIRYEGMSVWLSPPGKAILGYKTHHYERLPSEVLGGVPSRFRRKNGQGHEPIGPALDDREVQHRVRTAPKVTGRLIESWARRCTTTAEEAERQLLAMIVADAVAGTWQTGKNQGTLVLVGKQCWAVRVDTAHVVATFPIPEPPDPAVVPNTLPDCATPPVVI